MPAAIACADDAAALQGWRARRVVFYTLRDAPHLPGPPVGAESVSLVDLATLRRHALPADLLAALSSAANHSPIAATWFEGAPVSFCYAGTMTASLWDVAVDTLEAQRGRGRAMRCVTFMVHLMRRSGREPVWGALETNLASRRLAEKLGFAAV